MNAPPCFAVKDCNTGRGVFATQPIRAGSHIMHYTGPLLSHAQTSPATLALQIGPDLYIGESGNADDFVNHCCTPNAGILIDGTDVRLVAIADISAGDQITFDYSTTMDEDDFEFDCLCGADACRGRIGDFKRLPADLRKRYAELRIVPVYNQKYV
jgi:SET domain-containing protein